MRKSRSVTHSTNRKHGAEPDAQKGKHIHINFVQREHLLTGMLKGPQHHGEQGCTVRRQEPRSAVVRPAGCACGAMGADSAVRATFSARRCVSDTVAITRTR